MKCKIASGPVIIEKNKVLLVIEGKDIIWKFPGGTVRGGESLEQACRREVKEELGIKVKLIKPIKPLIIYRQKDAVFSMTYLAKRVGKIKPGKEIKKYKWFPLNKLPKNSGANIKPVIKEYLQHAKSK